MVNYVGVDLNTAFVPLSGYVAGINAAAAENIIADPVQFQKENEQSLSRVQSLDPADYIFCPVPAGKM